MSPLHDSVGPPGAGSLHMWRAWLDWYTQRVNLEEQAEWWRLQLAIRSAS